MSLITPEPYECAYLADLKRLLEQIRVSNGYHTDAGAQVYTADERLDPEEGSEIQLILTDGEEQLVAQDGYTRDVRLRVEVEIFVPVGPDANGRTKARDRARRALADVRQAVLQGIKGDSFKSRPINITCEGRTLFPLEAGSGWQLAIQPVLIRTREEFQSV